MNCGDKIRKARTQLILRYPFFGHLACSLKLKEKKILFPLGTDGKTIYYNPKLVEEMDVSEREMEAIIAHEIMHLVLGHPWRRGTKNHMKWNSATDLAINALLDYWGFRVPDWGMLEEEFREMSAEEIYESLPNFNEIKCQECDSTNVTIKNLKVSERAKGTEALKAKGELQCRDCGNEFGQDLTVLPGGGGESWKSIEGIPFDDHGLWENVEREGGKSGRKAWGKKVSRAENSARMHGDIPAGIDRIVQNITRPRINWRALLRRYVLAHDRDEYTWSRPNRRMISHEVYIPSLKSEKLRVAIAVDTSGSVSEKDLEQFMGEMYGILDSADSFRAELIACDAEVHAHVTARREEEFHEFMEDCEGGGGTNFRPVFDQLEEEEVKCLVYLTDGMGNYPQKPPSYDVIWALNQRPWGRYEPPFGRKVLINRSGDAR